MLAPTMLGFIAISHSDSGDIPTTSAVHNRAVAITIYAGFNSDWPCAEHYRPYFFRRILYSSFSIRPFWSMDLSCSRRFSSAGIL